MLLACPQCEGAIEATDLDPAAGVARCARCGEIRPRVGTPVLAVPEDDAMLRAANVTRGWFFDWSDAGGELRMAARYRPSLAERVAQPSVLGVLSLALLCFALCALARDARELALGLGASGASLVVAFLLARHGEHLFLVERARLAWTTVGYRRASRTLPLREIVRFRMEVLRDSEGDLWRLLVDTGGGQTILAVHSAAEPIEMLRDRLNEALFVLRAARDSAPYRART